MTSEDMSAIGKILGFQKCQREETDVHGQKVNNCTNTSFYSQKRRHTPLKKISEIVVEMMVNRDRVMAEKVKREKLKKQRREEKKQTRKGM